MTALPLLHRTDSVEVIDIVRSRRTLTVPSTVHASPDPRLPPVAVPDQNSTKLCLFAAQIVTVVQRCR
jgi:hypothetical protein